MRTLRLICLLVSVLAAVSAGAAQRVRFEHLTINDGLPENSVRSMLQDRYGFLWFGTQNGLARYDGYRMRTFLPDPDDPDAIRVRFVITMAEDSRGRIWLGSYSTGLAIYDPQTETFANFFTSPDTPDSLPGSGIVDLEAVDDEVWISTTSGRLFRSDGADFTPVSVPPLDDLQAATGARPLTGLKVTPRHVWVGSSGHGLAVQNRATGAWTHLTHDSDDPESLPSNHVTDIFRDRGGRIWVACTRVRGDSRSSARGPTWTTMPRTTWSASPRTRRAISGSGRPWACSTSTPAAAGSRSTPTIPRTTLHPSAAPCSASWSTTPVSSGPVPGTPG
jgi:ligand-binding sensor domain-containing protein